MSFQSTNTPWFPFMVAYDERTAGTQWDYLLAPWRLRWQALARTWRTVSAIATSLGHFVASFRVLRWQLAADGAVQVVHVPTGSVATFRADGNVDVFAARNAWWQGGRYVLLGDDPQGVDRQEVT